MFRVTSGVPAAWKYSLGGHQPGRNATAEGDQMERKDGRDASTQSDSCGSTGAVDSAQTVA